MQTIDQPFVKIIIPAAAGVIAARLIEVPAAVALVCFAVIFACTIAFRRHKVGHIYLWFTISLFFFAASTIARPRAAIPQGVRIEAVAQIAENPYKHGRWQRTTANVGYYRAEGDMVWTRVDERIQLYADTCYRIAVGQQTALRGWLNPIDTTGNGYGDLMRLRGQHGRLYLTPGNLVRTAPHVSRTPVYYASRLQDAAVKRLARLRLDPDELAVVTAMTAGDKRNISRELRGNYSDTGAAHLLAVSGLHVGIVFMLVNLLLYLLPAVRRGHIWKNALAVAAVWLYAAMAGLAPSVVRATLMFSFAQAALASGSTRNALNIMLGSAVVMLALNPNYWGDPGFMLSYAAVLSIAAFFGPVFRRVRSRYKAVNVLVSIIIVGLAASLGTAPLIAWWFGDIPIAGMVINPVVILTAHIVVMFGVLWVMMPFEFLNPLFSWVLEQAAWVQNSVVAWSASLRWASTPVDMPLWCVVLIYAGYIALAVWINRSRERVQPAFG